MFKRDGHFAKEINTGLEIDLDAPGKQDSDSGSRCWRCILGSAFGVASVLLLYLLISTGVIYAIP